MTKDERRREGVELVAKRRRDRLEMMTGRDQLLEKCKQEVVKIADRRARKEAEG